MMTNDVKKGRGEVGTSVKRKQVSERVEALKVFAQPPNFRSIYGNAYLNVDLETLKDGIFFANLIYLFTLASCFLMAKSLFCLSTQPIHNLTTK